jgi:hypothetical protein
MPPPQHGHTDEQQVPTPLPPPPQVHDEEQTGTSTASNTSALTPLQLHPPEMNKASQQWWDGAGQSIAVNGHRPAGYAACDTASLRDVWATTNVSGPSQTRNTDGQKNKTVIKRINTTPSFSLTHVAHGCKPVQAGGTLTQGSSTWPASAGCCRTAGYCSSEGSCMRSAPQHTNQRSGRAKKTQ